VLGLIGLAIPIRRVFTDEISTAWFAVSLVPKTVVAGQGVRIWLRWTSVYAGLLLLLTAVVSVVPPTHRLTAFEVAFVAVIVGTWAWVVAVSLGKQHRAARPPVGRLETSAWTLVTAVSVNIGYFPALYAFFLFNPEILDQRQAFWPEMFSALGLPIGDDGNFVVGVISTFLAGFFFGLPTAIRAYPPLPEVVITMQPEPSVEGVPDHLEGWLVAHSDAYWHLFVIGEAQRELLSIPDDKVLVVRMLAEVKRPLLPDTKPGMEKAK
jgi:hypothetical protein